LQQVQTVRPSNWSAGWACCTRSLHCQEKNPKNETQTHFPGRRVRFHYRSLRRYTQRRLCAAVPVCTFGERGGADVAGILNKRRVEPDRLPKGVTNVLTFNGTIGTTTIKYLKK
jgi:hypothetical protein